MQEDSSFGIFWYDRGYPHFPKGSRHNHHPQSSITHPCKKQSVKNTFVRSNNMVPERGICPLVIQYYPCHNLLRPIRFLCIEESIEVTLQVSLLYIFLIGFIKYHAKSSSFFKTFNLCLSKTFPIPH